VLAVLALGFVSACSSGSPTVDLGAFQAALTSAHLFSVTSTVSIETLAANARQICGDSKDIFDQLVNDTQKPDITGADQAALTIDVRFFCPERLPELNQDLNNAPPFPTPS